MLFFIFYYLFLVLVFLCFFKLSSGKILLHFFFKNIEMIVFCIEMIGFECKLFFFLKKNYFIFIFGLLDIRLYLLS